MLTSPLKDAALDYAKNGFGVIPLRSTSNDGTCSCGNTKCSSPGKHPITKSGINDATTDPNIIEEWWQRHPNANIGMAMGNGFIAIDIDVKNGAKGKDSLKDLEQEFGKLPKTLTAHTPTGGEHLIFKTDEKFTNRVGVLPGIDLRTDGGYIVVSPSLVYGVPYQWENESTKIATLPTDVAKRFQKAKKKKTGSKKQNTAIALSGVDEGSRNDSLFKYACRLRALDLSYEEAKVLILTAANQCSPPLDLEEAIRCLDSAYKRYEPSTLKKLTELGNAERFAEAYGDSVRYVPEFGCWLYYDGFRWTLSKHGEIESLAKTTVRSIYDEADTCTDEKIAKAIRQHAKASERLNSICHMLTLARAEGLSVPASLFDSHDHLFGVLNGVIDLSNGSYRKSCMDDFITQSGEVKFVKRKGCKRWRKFILEIMNGNKEMANFIQRLVGYTLLGGNPEEIIIIFYGHGANGKSTLIKILNMLLGSYSKNVDSSTYMLRKNKSQGGTDEATVRLKGARATFTTEIPDGQVLDEDLVKKMTGDDILTARKPYASDSVEFKPKFTPYMATNHKPIIQGDDHAIWRRIVLVPFECTFEIDKSLSGILESELSGILNWAIDGCMKYQQEGLNVPQSVQDATKEYRSEMDLLIDWIDDYCITNSTEWESTAALYKSYEEWCILNGCTRYFDRRIFGRKLSDRGYTPKKVKGARGFCGIAIKKGSLPSYMSAA